MNSQFQIDFDLQSYWHIGNGKEAGAYADALVLKDKSGLPYLPGKSIKGLLRQAFSTAYENQWFECKADNLIELLFGDEQRAGQIAQGLIQVSSASLSEAEIAYFNTQPEAKSHLYRVISSTAIEHESGVAKEASLRSIEVTIPVNLTARLSLNVDHPSYQTSDPQIREQFGTWLSQATMLITEIGARRHRGLGKVIVSVKPSGKKQI